jgi:Ca-activated chloride channel homolog
MIEHDNNFDETQLTAYALGELDSAETAEVEAFLAENPDAQKTVDDIRQMAELLAKDFAGAEALSLTDAQRQAVEAGPEAGVGATACSQAVPKRLRIFRVALAAAAVVIIGLAAILYGPKLWSPEADPAPPVHIADPAPPEKPDEDPATTLAAKITKLEEQATALAAEREHEQALKIVNEILELDPQNMFATSQMDLLEQFVIFQKEHERFGSNDPDRKAYLSLKIPIMPMDFNQMPLVEVIRYLREATGTGIQVKWNTLMPIGISRDTLVTVKHRQGTFAQALQVLLADLGDEVPLNYTVEEGVIKISTQDDLASNMVTRVYDIQDLIGGKLPDFVGPMVDVSGAPDSPSSSVGGGFLAESDGDSGWYYGRTSVSGPVTKSLGSLGYVDPRSSEGREIRRGLRVDTLESETPWQVLQEYPEEWTELTRQRREFVKRDPYVSEEDRQAYLGLMRNVGQVDFREVRFEEAIRYLGEVAGADINVKWPELADVGLTRDTPITLLLPDQTFEQTLQILLTDRANSRLAYRVVSGVVIVSTAADLPEPKPIVRAKPVWNREAYDYVVDNPFRDVGDHPLSTFSIDVDTASYSNTRRMLTDGQLPPAGAVRIEEMVNYFNYDYLPPSEEDPHPFKAYVSVANCPWNAQHALMRVALKGLEIEPEERPAGNYVFLLDVSGSMQPENKLPLVKRAMIRLLEELTPEDRLAIVVYAGAAGLVLDSTPCNDEEAITAALDRLAAGGSTQGSAGIQLAYDVAAANFIEGGVNRVILCTDGDFNVGITSESELVTLIEDKAKTGVFLTVLGFGMGNYQDSRLEKLADKGNGNYGYVDTYREARKILVEQLTGTLITIAKDVKIQIEFNPANVAAYRLIGYENRILAKEDFNDDTKDAGEIGAGHTVTALYEIIPAGQPVPTAGVDELKYQQPVAVPDDAPHSDELMTLKLRYKAPDGDTSTLMEIPVENSLVRFDEVDLDFQFATAVAAFGMILRDSPYKGTATLDYVLETAQAAQGIRGETPDEYRAEFVELVKLARELMNR